MKKVFALMLCAALMLSCVSGCGGADDTDTTGAADSADTGADTGEGAGEGEKISIDLAAGYGAYEPDRVMLTVNGEDVTWQELFYFMNYYITYVEYNGATITGWDDEATDGMTFQEYVIQSAEERIVYEQAIAQMAGEMDITLTPKDEDFIQSEWEDMLAQFESEEALLEYLEENFTSKEFCEDLTKMDLIAQNCYTAMFGERGSAITDEEVSDFLEDEEYITAKHILISHGDGAEETAQDLMSKLENYSGDDFDAYFDELMMEYSDDEGGLADYPDGYLFKSGDMVEEFETMAYSLEVGSFGLVSAESTGYHIIYRIPVNYDLVPMEYASYAQYYGSAGYELRNLVGNDMFNSIVLERMNRFEIVLTPEYENLNFHILFGE